MTLATASAPITAFEMEPLEAIAHRLLDPTTAYLLFVLGLFAVLVELAHPGSLVPGAIGVACLTLASIAFAALPTNWLGVAVIVAAVGLMAVELKAATHGALVLAGAVCLIVGSLLLVRRAWFCTADTHRGHHRPGRAGWRGRQRAASVACSLVRVARQIHVVPPVLSLEQLIGAHGTSRSELDPDGVVHVGGQLWSARVRGRRLARGSTRARRRPTRPGARSGVRDGGRRDSERNIVMTSLIVNIVVLLVILALVGWHPEPVDPHRARVPAHRPVPPGQVRRRSGARTHLADSVRRSAGAGRYARAVRRDPASELHHQGQRADPDRLPGLPPGHRRGEQRRRGDQLRQRCAGHRRDDAARCHRRHRARRRARPTRADQQRPAASNWTRSPNAGESK